MVTFPRFAVLLCCIALCGICFAAGGSCPSGANYLNPANVTGAKVTLASLGITSCYYISAAGSDSNTGTTEASGSSGPWLHAPGMNGCSSVCASTSPAVYSTWAGIGFIFRGGDVWSLPEWGLNWAGTSANPIYYGFDPAWYSGTAWARPILDDAATDNGMLAFYDNNIIFDNFEFRNVYVCDNNTNKIVDARNTVGSIFEENYFHDFTNCTPLSAYNLTAVYGSTSIPIVFNVWDNSDGSAQVATAYYGYGIEFAYNYINDFPNIYVGGAQALHDNVFNNLTADVVGLGNTHQNQLENNTSPSFDVIYNNVMRHGSAAGSNVTLWDAPYSPNTGYIFNNVIYDTTTANVFDVGSTPLSGTVGTDQAFNNTIECGPDSSPTARCINTPGVVITKNNHWIGPSATGSGNVWGVTGSGSVTETSDIAQSKATANGQGYTETNGFAPTASSDATVGAGTNLATLCASVPTPTFTGANPQAACKQSTTFGVAYNSTTHTVSYPAITPVTRPASGAWDVGAYQYGGGGPNPPTGLVATVH